MHAIHSKTYAKYNFTAKSAPFPKTYKLLTHQELSLLSEQWLYLKFLLTPSRDLILLLVINFSNSFHFLFEVQNALLKIY